MPPEAATDTMSGKKEGQTRGSFYRLRPLDWFLVAVPLAFFVRFIPAWKNETLLFFISGVALIPLAAWLGRATEHLSARAGPGVGGLLNATLGNAPELILSLVALSKGNGNASRLARGYWSGQSSIPTPIRQGPRCQKSRSQGSIFIPTRSTENGTIQYVPIFETFDTLLL
jgi:hypothetical protein